MDHYKKCLVAHAGSRDFYQVALAFYETALLDTLVTDCFVPDTLANLTKRGRSGIPFTKVKINRTACWEFFKAKIPFLPSLPDFVKTDAAISKTSLHTSLSHKCNLLLYSYYAHDAFSYLHRNQYPNKKILFQVHPHPLSIRKILKDDMERLPYARASIEKESEFLLTGPALEKLCEEIHLSDCCVAASSFTKRTLIENGASPDKIALVPYGVDTRKFPPKKRMAKKAPEGLRIIFIGSMIQRKGLADLLLALRILNSDKIQLTLVGYKMDKQLLDHFSDLNITVKVHVAHDVLLKEMHAADVFVLPSLAEGFAHVILEAMATGLPVITTGHTAGPDVINDGSEGFLIPVRSPEIIAEKLEFLLQNREVCEGMGYAAASKARELTWQKFRNGIIAYYKSLKPAC